MATTQIGKSGDLGKLPLIFGVGGHRDLRAEDIPELKSRIRAVLVEYRRLYPHTPFVMLSALAEGADTIATEVALQADIGCTLHACLPQEPTEYEKHFGDDAARQYFHAFLAAASNIKVVNSGNSNARPRDDAYAAAGHYIVERSHILLVLWDGHENYKEAGTAEMVKYRRDYIPRAEQDVQKPQLSYGPTIHIVTPRRSAVRPQRDAFAVFTIEPTNAKPSNYGTVYTQVEEFNLETVLNSNEGFLKATSTAAVRLLPSADYASVPEATQIREIHAVADQLSLRSRSRTFLLLEVFVMLAVLGGVGFDLFSNLLGDWWYSSLLTLRAAAAFLLGFSFLTTAVAIWLHRWSLGKALQSKFQSYRTLAEVLRTQFYWTNSGIHQCAMSNLLAGEGAYVRFVSHCATTLWTLVDPHTIESRRARYDHVSQLLEFWIQDQGQYFEGAYDGARRGLRTYEILHRWLSAGSTLAAVAVSIVFCWNAFRPFPHVEHGISVLSISVFTAGLLALLLAINHFRAHTRAFADHVVAFDAMRHLYTNAAQELSKSNRYNERLGLDNLRAALIRLGRNAVAENLDWLSTHTYRPVQPVRR